MPPAACFYSPTMIRATTTTTFRRSITPKPTILNLQQHYHPTLSHPPPSHNNLQILPEVQNALLKNQPIIALESTILSHGLPYPENLQLSQELSHIIRSKNVIPATIAVKNGTCCVGLIESDIHDLVVSGGEGRATKCTTRDLPFFIRNKKYVSNNDIQKTQWGATTVASTMRIAHLAGISTFVTGGTGGVHRGAETTMDISSDLLELSRTPVIVISAGIKSILDIPKTLEMLETLSVPVASFQSDDFPSFFSPTSGVKSPMRIDDVEDAANAYMASLDLGLGCGMLVAVPNYDPVGRAVEDAIQETIEEANSLGIVGRHVTPFILKRVSEKTKGDSLRSNTALVKRNAEVGAGIAIAVAKLKLDRMKYTSTNSTSTSCIGSGNNYERDSNIKSKVVVVGGAVIDIVAKSKNKIIPETSNPGFCTESDGGVGRNIADVLGQLGAEPILYTAIGDDSRGKGLRQRMGDYDIPKERQFVKMIPNSNTATYLAILDNNGNLHNAIADMEILKEIPLPEERIIKEAEYLVIDANLPMEKLLKIVQMATRCDTRVIFDPTSVPKASTLKGNDNFLSCISFAFPNVDELMAMIDIEQDYRHNGHVDRLYDDNFKGLKDLTVQLLNRMHPQSAHLIVTLGPMGAFLASKESTTDSIGSIHSFQHFAVKENLTNLQNCTGAGDTMVGVFVKSLLDGNSIEQSIEKGMDASLISIKYSQGAIPRFIQ